ncbi:hypothetical protein HP439_13455 [Sphingobacterium shayense]|uniref:type IV pilus modification PilV family protein n=1 Tax=Sphingobacterium shayense TaxID=626343 RepID=UPI001551EDD1|nr:hypothetical protein [Sphingobacterium shayense]NQD71731.1 hypothetical protein [Sphingobacterium shayense]
MGKLNILYNQKTTASTLVEVLVALVILLSVFAVGMLIFARLNQASSSQTRQTVHLQLREIASRYVNEEWDTEQTFQYEHILYSLEEEQLSDYADRIRVKIYAFDTQLQKPVDSLILIHPFNEK